MALEESQKLRQAAEKLYARVGLEAILKLLAEPEFSTLASSGHRSTENLQAVRQDLCDFKVDADLIEEDEALLLAVQEITHLAFREFFRARP